MFVKKRQLIGLGIVILSSLGLLTVILEDHHIFFGPFHFLYGLFDWFSIGNFFRLIFESFESVFDFIFDYFWYLLFILFGIVLIFSNRQHHEDEIVYTYDEETHDTIKEDHQKRLTRNLDDMKLAGVCSGIAHYLSVDPTIIRIITCFLGLTTSGIFIIIYILLMIFLPGEHQGY